LLNFKLRTDLTVWLTLTYALCVYMLIKHWNNCNTKYNYYKTTRTHEYGTLYM